MAIYQNEEKREVDLNTKRSRHRLGTFEVGSGGIRVSDPCYDTGTWCSGDVDVVNGVWEAEVVVSNEDNWGEGVAELICYNKDLIDSHGLLVENWKRVDIEVGVDSGQAGFFDKAHFKGGQDEYGDDGWYDMCCNKTSGNIPGAGVIPHGVVSRSGFGDGGYNCYMIEGSKKGEAIALKVIFIEEEEE